MRHGVSDSLSGHGRTVQSFCRLHGNIAIGHGLPIGNCKQNIIDDPAKGRCRNRQRRTKIRLLTGKIKIQPACCFLKDGLVQICR